MPFGNGKLFLPVEVPEELMTCLQDEPKALAFFKTLTEDEQSNYIKWIYSARTDQTKVERMADCIDCLSRSRKYYEKD